MNKTQNQIVLDRLKKGHPVNAVWAVNNYILRLSARIMNLKDQGHNIESFPLYKKNKKLPYCGYKLIDNMK